MALYFIPVASYEINCSATCAVVIDADTKTVLYNKNAYDERAIASTTKIMTAIIALESERLDEYIAVTDDMVKVEGTSLGLKSGDRITLYDLICGMLLTSGNDAANAIATAVGGNVNAFADMMNSKAQGLRMDRTVFVTPSGLDSGNNHSTAYDMAVLTAYCIENESFVEIVSKQNMDIYINGKKTTVYNHNKLLAMDENVFGVKTGYTKKAGRCLVSAKLFDKNRLICVTLNAPDDWNDHLALYKECEKCYKNYDGNESVSVCVAGGDSETVSGSYSYEYSLIDEPTVSVYYHPFVYAPVSKGDIIGCAYAYNGNKMIEKLPVTADEDVNYAKQE